MTRARVCVDPVNAVAAVLARIVITLVDVDLASSARVSGNARAEVIVLFVDARGAVHAGARGALVDVVLAVIA